MSNSSGNFSVCFSDIRIVQTNPYNTSVHISLNVGTGCKVRMNIFKTRKNNKKKVCQYCLFVLRDAMSCHEFY